MGTATWAMACLLLVANSGPADTFYIGQRSFLVPIGIKDPGRRGDIKEVLLYLAAPDGKTWQPIGRTTPDKDGFPFRAAEDGSYLFRMAVIDAHSGKKEDGEAKCIIVDTVKPVIEIQSAERQGDDVVVRWNVVERNPSWPTLRLEYLASATPDAAWTPVSVPAPESGQTTFHVDGPAAAVRLSMTDLAKNESGWVEHPVRNGGGIAAAGATGGSALPPLGGDAGHAPGMLSGQVDHGWSPAPQGGAVPTGLTKTGADASSDTVGGGVRPAIVAGSDSGPGTAPVGPARQPRGPLPAVQMVKKRQVTIDYEVTKFGPSGIKSVELYVTRDDGRSWVRCDGEDNINVQAPAEPRGGPGSLKRSLTVDLQADGLYGFYLIVKNGAGRGKPPPQNGIDVPQMRIEVDTVAPKAVLFEPRPHASRRDSLVFCWSAADKNLGPAPVTLQWSERPDGEWHAIGGGELPNAGDHAGEMVEGITITGSYDWQVPANIPARVYLKLLVRDLAGNESVAQPDQPQLVDLSEPEVKPLQITVSH
jgi:hypothetical protein